MNVTPKLIWSKQLELNETFGLSDHFYFEVRVGKEPEVNISIETSAAAAERGHENNEIVVRQDGKLKCHLC